MRNNELGDLLKEFKSKKNRMIPLIIGILLLVIGSILLLYNMKFVLFSLSTGYGIGMMLILKLFLVCILPALIGLLLIVFSKIRKEIYVNIHSNGLFYKKGKIEKIINWDDIVEFYYDITKHYKYGFIHINTFYNFTIKTRDNNEIIFDNHIQYIDEIGEMLKEYTTRNLLPKFIKEFNEGSTVVFGDISINKKGIQHFKDFISWHDVKNIKLDRGILSIKKEDKWFSWSNIYVKRIPNFFVFIEIADTIIKKYK